MNHRNEVSRCSRYTPALYAKPRRFPPLQGVQQAMLWIQPAESKPIVLHDTLNIQRLLVWHNFAMFIETWPIPTGREAMPTDTNTNFNCSDWFEIQSLQQETLKKCATLFWESLSVSVPRFYLSPYATLTLMRLKTTQQAFELQNAVMISSRNLFKIWVTATTWLRTLPSLFYRFQDSIKTKKTTPHLSGWDRSCLPLRSVLPNPVNVIKRQRDIFVPKITSDWDNGEPPDHGDCIGNLCDTQILQDYLSAN